MYSLRAPLHYSPPHKVKTKSACGSHKNGAGELDWWATVCQPGSRSKHPILCWSKYSWVNEGHLKMKCFSRVVTVEGPDLLAP